MTSNNKHLHRASLAEVQQPIGAKEHALAEGNLPRLHGYALDLEDDRTLHIGAAPVLDLVHVVPLLRRIPAPG